LPRPVGEIGRRKSWSLIVLGVAVVDRLADHADGVDLGVGLGLANGLSWLTSRAE
jgi:hypothetical protein